MSTTFALPDQYKQSLCIKYDPVKGRGLFALHALHPGDVALIERPAATTISPLHCSECLSLVPQSANQCAGCHNVSYCSKPCQVNHWPVHKLECKVIKQALSAKLPSFTPRVSLSLKCVLLQRHIESLSQSSKEEWKPPIRMFESQLSRCHSLTISNTVTDSHSDAAADQAQSAELMLVVTALTGASGRNISMTGYDLRDSQQWLGRVRCNAIDLYDSRYKVCGIGICPTIAMINHSCVPNAALVTSNGQVYVRVISEIASGHELLIDYTGDDSAGITSMRRHKLRKRYHFTCHCPQCADSDRSPLKFSARDIERIGVKCRECDSYFPIDLDIENKITDTALTCHQCQSAASTLALFAPVQKCWQRINASIDKANDGHVTAALRLHEQSTADLSVLVHPHSLWLSSALQSQMEILRALRQDRVRLRLFDRLVSINAHHFPRFLPLYVATLYQHFVACLVADDRPALIARFDGVMESARVAFGPEHPIYQDILRQAHIVLRYRAQMPGKRRSYEDDG